MHPDSFATPSVVVIGNTSRPVSSVGGDPGFRPTTASVTSVPGMEPGMESVSSGAGSIPQASTLAGASAAPGHESHLGLNGNGNGNGLSVSALSHWSPPVSASAGGGTLVSSPPVLAAPLEDRGLYLRFGKRLLDVIGATVALVANSPLLLLAIIAIKLESPGPVLYRSKRIGRNGRPFTFLKLRSMVDGADRGRHHIAHLNEAEGPIFKIMNDPRVTRVGRILRITSIDEIPQFLNVLRGEMSLVGPRPPLPNEVAQYEPWQLHRLDVLPGLTCLWQISGRSRIGFNEWMRLDLEYIKHRSLGLDVKILLRTIPAVLSRDGAY